MRGWIAALLLAVMSGPAFAAPVPMLLELWRNGATDHTLVQVTMKDGEAFLAAADFPVLGVKVTAPAGDDIALDKVPGITVSVDQAQQRLLVTVDAALLPRQSFDLGAGTAPPPTLTGSGAILRYDLSGTVDDLRRFGRTLGGGASLALDLFRDDARFTGTGFLRDGQGAVRLDSAVTLDRPARLSHLSFGDAISVTPDWGRAVRFGGVEYASDFSLAPGLITTPLPSFFGSSDVPATVDVYSGAAKVAQQQVAPGPFEIQNLPIVTGGGAATVVVRDVLGRETTQSLALFTDKGLLAPGRHAFAVDLGFKRFGYGLDSFSYGTPMASGDWRFGLTSHLTTEGHVEFGPGQATLGGSAEFGFNHGILSASLAGSQGPAGEGWLAALSGQLRSGWLNLYGSGQVASADYRDLASLNNNLLNASALALPRWRLQAGAATDLGAAGALALSWIGEKPAAGAAQSLLSASWSLSLPNGMFFVATGLRDLAAGASSGEISLGMPLGGRALASVSTQVQGGQATGMALYDDPADPDGGVGVRGLLGADTHLRAEAEVRYVGDHVDMDGGLALAGGAPALRTDMAGALVLLGGNVFATHDPGEAVALVKTGEPGIHITRENRTVAVSDAQGEALLTGLVPYADNHLGVEQRDYPFTALVEKTDMNVAPPRGGAAIADFTPASRHPLLVTVTQGPAAPLPAGAHVLWGDDEAVLPLGHDGQFFIADMGKRGRSAVVETAHGRCRTYVTADGATGAMPHTPTLLCFREAQVAY